MFGLMFVEPSSSDTGSGSYTNTTTGSSSDDEDSDKITLDDLHKDSLPEFFKSLSEIMQHKPPTLFQFLAKPGIYLVLVFWFFYVTSIFYYTGRDRVRRSEMTK